MLIRISGYAWDQQMGFTEMDLVRDRGHEGQHVDPPGS